MECHNTTLRSEIKQLHEEREQLTRIIQNHASICPLTPRQSPLTISRDSPLSHSVRESPLPLASFTGNLLATSPVMGKSPVLVQSPAILVPPTRESPVPLLIINPARESPIPTSLVPSSPVPMSGRPRKSPVSLLRFNQSPIPGEKSPIPFGSPPKQSKHSIPARLNLARPVVPILPKPAPTTLHNSPSPRTPKTIITSPLPIAASPGSLGRSLHVSPVFFREGCFTPSGHSRQVSQSPISADSSSSSTPARITQQSPVFFVDRAPSAAQHGSHFLQPLSVPCVSSTPALMTLLRQDSPLSVLSNNSAISSTSSVFISNTPNLSVSAGGLVEVSKPETCVSGNLQHSSNTLAQVPPVYSRSAPGNAEDNVLSLEEIEKSASGFEARDDLIDMMDIQALLELSNDHNIGHVTTNPGAGDRVGADLGCHSINQKESNMQPRATDHQDVHHSGCNGTHNIALLRAPSVTQSQYSTSAQARKQDICVSLLTQNLNKLPGLSIEQGVNTRDGGSSMSMEQTIKSGDSATTRGQDGCSFDSDLSRCHSAFRELGTGHFHSPFESPKRPGFRDNSATIDLSVLQTFRESQARKSLTVATLQQLHNQLSELIRRQRLTESSSSRGHLPASLSDDRGRSLADDNCFLAADDLPNGSGDASESDLMNLHSSLPLDVLMASGGADHVFSHTSNP